MLTLFGCSDRERTMAPPVADDAVTTEHRPDRAPLEECGGLLGLRQARLRLTTTDPNQTYVEGDKDPWRRWSWLSEASSFNLVVTNVGPRTVRDVQILVAVPSKLPEFGWSVTIGQTASVLSGPADFPHRNLSDSLYPPLPRGIYAPRGAAQYAIVPGPATLAPGESVSIPVSMYRGTTEGFKVHFDVASHDYWNGPHWDVVAFPPMQEDFAGR